MKALSIRQPWVWAILRGGKSVENRDWRWSKKYRGPLLIHAGSGCTRNEYFAGELSIEIARRHLNLPPLPVPPFKELRRGGFLGIARLVDITRNPSFPDNRGFEIPDVLGLRLEDIEELPFVPASGALGFFNVDGADLPDAYVEAWERLTLIHASRPEPKTRRGTPV